MIKIRVRIIFVIGLALIFIGIVFSIVHLPNNNHQTNQPAMLKIETVADDAIVKGNHFPKSVKYYDVANNGDLTRSKATTSFKRAKNQRIDIDADHFDTYATNDNTELHLNIVKPIKLKDQNGKTVANQNYWRMINHVVKHVPHDITTLSLFKTKEFYYAYYIPNAGPSDDDYLLRYNPKTKKFKRICEIDGRRVVKIQELK